MSESPLFDLTFEPSGTSFFDYPDGSLYSVHAGRAVAVNDGQFISSEEIRDSSISVYLKTAQHGTHAGDPASLLLFHFAFFSPAPKNRIKSASIDIELNYSAKPRPPHIHSFCPRHVVGIDVQRTISTELNGGISVGNTMTPALAVNLGTSRTESLERSSRFTLVSKITKTHSNGRVVNGIRLLLTENENSKGGIPYFVPIALLIKRKDTRNFIAQINIAAKISPSINPKSWFGMFASIPKPVVIDVNTLVGNSIVENVDVFEDVDLETLVDLPDYI